MPRMAMSVTMVSVPAARPEDSQREGGWRGEGRGKRGEGRGERGERGREAVMQNKEKVVDLVYVAYNKVVRPSLRMRYLEASAPGRPVG